ELYFSIGRDEAQDGSDFSDQNVLKDRVFFIKKSPYIKINSGNVTGSLSILGIEEMPENNENDEFIKLSKIIYNAQSTENDTINITLKNNTLSFERKDNPFINLSNSAITWGDYDRDGDMDLAIMGQSNTVGAVTTIYKNNNGTFEDTEQSFAKVYDGDISWVDLNKDGWLDLVVSGYNETAKTSIYISNKGETFESTSDSWGIPNAYRSVMSWGDLDNDGDIDLAFSGLDEGNNMFHTGYLRVDNEDKFIPTEIGYFSAINGDHAIADFDQDSDNDVIFSGEYGNEIRSQIKLNSFYLLTLFSLLSIVFGMTEIKNTAKELNINHVGLFDSKEEMYDKLTTKEITLINLVKAEEFVEDLYRATTSEANAKLFPPDQAFFKLKQILRECRLLQKGA
ncbi:VCBS repeat-containing protein, partial [archaeon]|nr:VCBS repeat-containing protein [archaeon]